MPPSARHVSTRRRPYTDDKLFHIPGAYAAHAYKCTICNKNVIPAPFLKDAPLKNRTIC